MYEIDFEKVATEFNKKRENPIAPVRLKAIYKGTYPHVEVELAVKKMLIDGKGEIKKKFLKVDYNEVAKEIYKKHGKFYTKSYLKGAHEGMYASNKVLCWINEILSK